jgi:hypothetical protein
MEVISYLSQEEAILARVVHVNAYHIIRCGWRGNSDRVNQSLILVLKLGTDPRMTPH